MFDRYFHRFLSIVLCSLIQSSLLNDAYKAQAELEVQLNVAKSNLQLVIANNDMLEDALKRSDSGQSRDVGWRRTNVREGETGTQRTSLDRSNSTEYSALPTEIVSPPNSATPPTSSDNRFFKFKFSSMSPNVRPGTPTQTITSHHLNSPSMPSLSSLRSKELEELTAELEKERAARKALAKEKSDLEDELESLSQALFEEVRLSVLIRS